ncbi:UNVERIFIED_CONTAM: hypothetical protein PYX00_006980 [Menopon gallinae]|uniref:N-acetyltransferase domain-containing protein n=1 Tax=Menopon gallinae TaxID=328185 RepID=A0AAW2HH93_9NEOP
MDEFDSKHEVASNIYYAGLLHDHPQLLDDCCELINMEWKRSHTARLRSISGSSDNFPTSIVLLKDAGKPAVVGHCKLTKLSHSNPVIFIESVVIHPDYRGKGLGKLLMHKAESYLKRKNIEWIYLSTLGQEVFYEKLGYLTCDPINIYGGQINLLPQNNNHFKEATERNESVDKNFNKIVGTEKSACLSGVPPPPPPPPPMPSFNSKVVYVTNKKTFMRKKIL